MRALALITSTVTALTAQSLPAQAPGEAAPTLEARVWLDRGDEPVLRRGETARIFYRATEDAYAAIFRIDTDGRISLIYPQDPTMAERLAAGVDYRLIFPRSPVWRVNDDPGMGYLFMVASPYPLDFSAFPFDPVYGWDLGAVGDVVYEDPYVAIDEYVAYLIPDWEEVPYGLDFVTYTVGDTYTYPRFLCYDCHGARPYATWNPYAIPCTSYRVVIYDDPYFYPYYRYSGTAVVVSRPVVTQPRYAVAVRSAGDSYRPLIRSRTPPPRRTAAQFKESAETGPAGVAPRDPTPQRQPSSRPTLQRRPDSTPGSRLPVRTPPSSPSGRAAPSRGSGTPDATIVRPGRSSTPSTSSAPRTPSRPSDRVAPSRGSSTPTARPPTSDRPSTRPSTSPRPSTRSTTPSRPGTGSATPSRPQAGAPSSPTPQSARSRPSPSRPSPQPRSAPRSSAPSRPAPAPSRPPRASSGPSTRAPAPSRPSTGRPSDPPRSSAPGRPSAGPRPNDAGRR